MIGDLHFGHKNVCRFRDEFEHEMAHREYLMRKWKEVVGKRDLVYVLGDAAFSWDGLWSIRLLPGRKKLVRGNHDLLGTQVLLEVFEEVHGFIDYRGVWLSHCPIHPQELRGKVNIHGHVHTNTVPDERYINVSAEMIDYTPVPFKDLVP